MAYTQADIDALREKIKAVGPVRGTSFGDQTTTFDLDAGLKLLALMEREVAAAAGQPTTRYVTTAKGV